MKKIIILVILAVLMSGCTLFKKEKKEGIKTIQSITKNLLMVTDLEGKSITVGKIVSSDGEVTKDAEKIVKKVEKTLKKEDKDRGFEVIKSKKVRENFADISLIGEINNDEAMEAGKSAEVDYFCIGIYKNLGNNKRKFTIKIIDSLTGNIVASSIGDIELDKKWF